MCVFLDEGDEFRKKVQALKESHANLLKVNRELLDIKQILNSRSSPPVEDRKFVQSAHEEASGQVKNVYSHLSQQLRADRTPKTLSFWWPVLFGLALVGAGSAGLWTYQARTHQEMRQQAEQSGEAARLELMTLQTERDDLGQKLTAAKEDYEKKIAELKQQNAGWRNAGREKIEELETRVKDLEFKNDQLSQKAEKLAQESYEKDRVITELSTAR